MGLPARWGQRENPPHSETHVFTKMYTAHFMCRMRYVYYSWCPTSVTETAFASQQGPGRVTEERH